MMRVLLVTNMFPTPARPSYGIFVKEQADAVRAACPDVDYDIHYIDTSRGNSAYLKSITRIAAQLRRGDYDLVHIHYGLSGLFLLNPFLRCKTPVMVTLHGGDIQAEQGKTVQVALTKLILRRADLAVSLNDRMTGIVQRCCPNVAKVPCSVNTSVFTPPSSPRPSLHGRRDITVLFPSDRSRFVKNYPLFRDTLRLLEQDHGIRVTETVLENMTRTQVAETMRRADLMLMTSISEGSPQAVKEAMACNLPVISTKVGDVDCLLDGVADSGWVTDHTPRALCAKIMEALSGSIPGRTGREQITALGLDDASVAARIHHLYLTLLPASAR